jgi:hypothetical protein
VEEKMDAQKVREAIASLEAQRNALLAQLTPHLQQLAVLDGMLAVYREQAKELSVPAPAKKEKDGGEAQA